MASCPAHEDPSPSLSIATGGEGRALIHCFAGCAYSDVIDALDLRTADTFDPDPEPPKASKPRPPAPLPTETQVERWSRDLLAHPAALERLRELRGWSEATVRNLDLGIEGARITAPVRDAAGQIVNLMRIDPAGTATPKTLVLRGRARALYPPPEAFSRPSVWIVEGEPDAISAHELGISAVGIPGVNGWRQEYAQRFTGRRVLIALDCDVAGRAKAAEICAALSPLSSPRVLDIAPERDDGYDWTDLLLDVLANGSLAHTRGVFARITSGGPTTPKDAND